MRKGSTNWAFILLSYDLYYLPIDEYVLNAHNSHQHHSLWIFGSAYLKENIVSCSVLVE